MTSKTELVNFANNLFEAKYGNSPTTTPVSAIKRFEKTQNDIAKGKIKTLRGVRRRIR